MHCCCQQALPGRGWEVSDRSLDSSAPWDQDSLSCLRSGKIEFPILARMCVEGKVDASLVVTKACLLISNVTEARGKTFLDTGIQELHFLGQGVNLDEYSKPYL